MRNKELYTHKSLLHVLTILALLLAAIPTGLIVQPVQALSPDIVISQVYGGGGNSGATLKNDFIELFNRGAAPVDITGWSVQYASSTGTTWQATNLSGTLQPGGYYLVQEAAGAGGSVNLPPPDASGSLALSATNGKVALVSNTTLLSGSCPAGVIDFVGYGSANCFEGAATLALSNTTAALRNSNGCMETDNNSADFSILAPDPRNTASATYNCQASSNPTGVGTASPNVLFEGDTTLLAVAVTPGQNPASTGLAVTGDLTLIGGLAAQPFFDDGSNGDTVAGDNTFSFLTTIALGSATGALTLSTTISDAEGRSGAAGISLTVRPAPIPIHDIQDASHLSPKNGMYVTTSGIVTSKRSNGFNMQDPNPDGDEATSEAIFVFTGAGPAVSVGDDLLVSGTVNEFRPGGASSTNLTTTELDNPGRIVTIVSSGNPLPVATVIGIGGRIPPGEVIEDDATGNVETSGIFDPASDGIDFYESLEGMLLQVNQAVAVGPTNSFGETAVVSDNGANAGVRTNRGGIVIQPTDFNPERVIVDDTITATPKLNVSDMFDAPVVGVLDYSFGNFKLLPSKFPGVLSGGLTLETTTAGPAYQLAVGTFNVENLSPNDPPAKFDRLADLIVNNLLAPDILAVEEIQDNNGATDNGVVDANQTYSLLIAAIQSAGGPTYQYRQINPQDNQDGGAPGGNIRQGFLFRVDRGLSFVDRPGGDAVTGTDAVMSASGLELTYSPGRIDPTNAAFTDSRKPLAGEFIFKGDKVFVVANHFNSKGGDQPLFGVFQPPTLFSEAQRLQQAQVVNNFVDSLLAVDPAANVVVLGDLNDFQFSNPLAVLKSGVLGNLIDTLPLEEQYTYVFDGNSQVLDHTLAGYSTLARPFTYDIVHVNAEFSDQASDHDPQAANLCVDATPPSISGTLSPGVLWPPNHKYVTVQANVTYSDNADPMPTIELLSVTSNEPDNGLGDGDTENDIVIVDKFTFQLRAERSGTGKGRTYAIDYKVTDACGNSSVAQGIVYVPHDRKDKSDGDTPIVVISQRVNGFAPRAGAATLTGGKIIYLPLAEH